MDVKKLINEMVHSDVAKENQINEDMYTDLVKPFDTNPVESNVEEALVKNVKAAIAKLQGVGFNVLPIPRGSKWALVNEDGDIDFLTDDSDVISSANYMEESKKS